MEENFEVYWQDQIFAAKRSAIEQGLKKTSEELDQLYFKCKDENCAIGLKTAAAYLTEKAEKINETSNIDCKLPNDKYLAQIEVVTAKKMLLISTKSLRKNSRRIRKNSKN